MLLQGLAVLTRHREEDVITLCKSRVGSHCAPPSCEQAALPASLQGWSCIVLKSHRTKRRSRKSASRRSCTFRRCRSVHRETIPERLSTFITSVQRRRR